MPGEDGGTGEAAPRQRAFDGILVAVPTFNEAGNVARLVSGLREHLPGAVILVIDDQSPDGTAEITAAIAEKDPLVRLHRRPEKLGLGTAYRHAFETAQAMGARVLLTLDADLSHRPEDAPAIVRAALQPGTDLALGSRYMPGGSINGWSRYRRVLSRVANGMIRAALDVRVTDCTGAFRAYRLELIERLDLADLRSTGYSSLPELLLLAGLAGAHTVEVPITFVEREHGATKLTRRELVDSLVGVVDLRRRRRRAERALRRRRR